MTNIIIITIIYLRFSYILTILINTDCAKGLKAPFTKYVQDNKTKFADAKIIASTMKILSERCEGNTV